MAAVRLRYVIAAALALGSIALLVYWFGRGERPPVPVGAIVLAAASLLDARRAGASSSSTTARSDRPRLTRAGRIGPSVPDPRAPPPQRHRCRAARRLRRHDREAGGDRVRRRLLRRALRLSRTSHPRGRAPHRAWLARDGGAGSRVRPARGGRGRPIPLRRQLRGREQLGGDGAGDLRLPARHRGLPRPELRRRPRPLQLLRPGRARRGDRVPRSPTAPGSDAQESLSPSAPGSRPQG